MNIYPGIANDFEYIVMLLWKESNTTLLSKAVSSLPPVMKKKRKLLPLQEIMRDRVK